MSPKVCFVIVSTLRSPTFYPLLETLQNAGHFFPGSALVVVDSGSSADLRSFLAFGGFNVVSKADGIIDHDRPSVRLVRNRRADKGHGFELGGYAVALRAGACPQSTEVFGFLQQGLVLQRPFTVQDLKCQYLNPVFYFPINLRRECCSPVAFESRGDGMMDLEARAWILEEVGRWRRVAVEMSEVVPTALADDTAFSDAVARASGAVQGASFFASSEAVQRLRSYGIFDLKIDSPWRGACSERLLGLAGRLLFEEDPAQCAIDGDMMFVARSQGSAFGMMEKVGVHFRKVWSTAITGRQFHLIGGELRYPVEVTDLYGKRGFAVEKADPLALHFPRSALACLSCQATLRLLVDAIVEAIPRGHDCLDGECHHPCRELATDAFEKLGVVEFASTFCWLMLNDRRSDLLQAIGRIRAGTLEATVREDVCYEHSMYCLSLDGLRVFEERAWSAQPGGTVVQQSGSLDRAQLLWHSARHWREEFLISGHARREEWTRFLRSYRYGICLSCRRRR